MSALVNTLRTVQAAARFYVANREVFRPLEQQALVWLLTTEFEEVDIELDNRTLEVFEMVKRQDMRIQIAYKPYLKQLKALKKLGLIDYKIKDGVNPGIKTLYATVLKYPRSLK